jgi:CHAT domain-containing protein/Tfp pilus assembly protein PilF
MITVFLVLLLFAFGAPAVASDGAIAIAAGETVDAAIAEGPPRETSVVFELDAVVSGPLIVETNTLHFDSFLRISVEQEDGASAELATDDDGGLAWNSRLTLSAEEGRRYRIEVSSPMEEWGGPFQLSVSTLVKPPVSDLDVEREKAKAYWEAVAAEGARTGKRVLEARARLGRGLLLLAAEEYEAASRELEAAHRLFEETVGSSHGRTAHAQTSLVEARRGPPIPIRVGETVSTTMPPGDPQSTAVAFLLRVEKDGPLNFETFTYEFDTDLAVYRLDEEGSYERLGRDGDHGLGWSDRLRLDVRTGDRLRIVVSPYEGKAGRDDRGGEFRLSVIEGEAEEITAEQERAHWDEVVAVGEAAGNRLVTARGAIGQVYSLRAEKRYREAAARSEVAYRIFDELLGPTHPTTVHARRQLANDLAASGEEERAITLLEVAVGTARERGTPSEAAAALASLASFQFSRKRNVEGVATLRHQIEILEAVHGRDASETRSVLWKLALYLREMGQCDEATAIYERLLAFCEEKYGPSALVAGKALDGLGWAHSNVMRWEEAATYFERALEIFEEHESSDWLMQSLPGYAWVTMDLGEFSQARRLVDRAMALELERRGRESSLTLFTLGRLLSYTGHYAEAKRLLERALAIRERSQGESHGTAYVISNLAVVYSSLGQHEEAARLLERNIAIAERLGWLRPQDEGYALIGLGVTLGLAGQIDRGLEFVERGRDLHLGVYGDEHPYAATGHANVGFLHKLAGRYDDAQVALEHAFQLYHSAYGDDFRTATVLQELGEVAMAQGRFDDALAMFERVRAICVRELGPDHPRSIDALHRLGKTSARLGRHREALDQALAALEARTTSVRLMVRELPERHSLALAASHAAERDLVLALGSTRLAEEPSAVARIWDALTRARGVVLDEISLRQRAIVETDDPEVLRLADELAHARERLANLMVRGVPSQAKEALIERLARAREKKEAAETALASKSARFAAELAAARIGWDDVIAALPDGTALVAYVRFDVPAPTPSGSVGEGVPEYVALVHAPDSVEPVLTALGDGAEIESLVSRWRARMAMPSDADPATETTRSGEALRERVWDPVREHLGTAAKVFVVPDGALHLVNFAALPTTEGTFLVESGPVFHYASAERDLLAAPSRRESSRGLLAVGGPAFGGTSSSADASQGQVAKEQSPRTDMASNVLALAAIPSTDREILTRRSSCGHFRELAFEELPGTDREVLAIADLWKHADIAGDATVLRGVKADETSLKRTASIHRYLHLATHGFFLGQECPSGVAESRGIGGLAPSPAFPEGPPRTVTGENPLLLAGLALAGANRREQAGPDEDDGILTAEEIAALDLSGVEWAVLSACDTGVGDVKAGEGVFGLRRAFQIAGARTLIMSLWSVDDESTREWMTALYDARLRKGKSTAESVRDASLSVLSARRKAGESTHPFHWAAFVAAGDWR